MSIICVFTTVLNLPLIACTNFKTIRFHYVCEIKLSIHTSFSDYICTH